MVVQVEKKRSDSETRLGCDHWHSESTSDSESASGCQWGWYDCHGIVWHEKFAKQNRHWCQTRQLQVPTRSQLELELQVEAWTWIGSSNLPVTRKLAQSAFLRLGHNYPSPYTKVTLQRLSFICYPSCRLQTWIWMIISTLLLHVRKRGGANNLKVARQWLG